MHFKNLKQAALLIDTQAKMKLKSESNRLFLSSIWWVLEPLLYVAMYYVVFEFILNRGGDDFLAFLFVGQIIYMWFSKSVNSASLALLQNKAILSVKKIPYPIFIFSSVQEYFYRGFFSIIVMILMLNFLGVHQGKSFYQIIPLLVITYFLISGISLVFSIFICIAEDFKQIINLFIRALMFLSGIFWDINNISNEQTKELLLKVNPLAALIDSFREVLLHKGIIKMDLLFYPICIALFFNLIGTLLFILGRKKISRSLIS